MAEKAARTSIQRKISSRLLNAYRICRGEEVAPAGAGLRGSVAVDARGTTLVDITAQVTPDVLVGIRSAGGDIVNSFPRHNAIRARIPLEQLEAVASLPAVQFIRPADQAVTRPGGSRPPPRPSEATAP